MKNNEVAFEVKTSELRDELNSKVKGLNVKIGDILTVISDKA